jgi:hypothetical protein
MRWEMGCVLNLKTLGALKTLYGTWGALSHAAAWTQQPTAPCSGCSSSSPLTTVPLLLSLEPYSPARPTQAHASCPCPPGPSTSQAAVLHWQPGRIAQHTPAAMQQYQWTRLVSLRGASSRSFFEPEPSSQARDKRQERRSDSLGGKDQDAPRHRE